MTIPNNYFPFLVTWQYKIYFLIVVSNSDFIFILEYCINIILISKVDYIYKLINIVFF